MADAKNTVSEKERQAYAERLQAEIDSWNADINRLRSKVKVASAEAQHAYTEEIEKIEAKRDALEERFSALKTANAGAWSDVKQGVERAWRDMSSAMTKAVDRFQ